MRTQLVRRRLVWLAVFVLARTGAAQTIDSTRASAWRPRGTDVALAGATTAVALGLLPFDAGLARRVDRTVDRSPRLAEWAQHSGVFGDPGAAVIAGTLLVGGRLSGRREVAATGLHGIEALAVSSAITASLKKLVGRARPNAVTDYAAFTFSPLQPRPGYASLPSGHATAAFTLAAVIDGELSQVAGLRAHPRWRRALTGVAYGLATATAASRVVERKHWASDVVLGAGIGLVSGRWVTRWRQQVPPHPVERWLTGP